MKAWFWIFLLLTLLCQPWVTAAPKAASSLPQSTGLIVDQDTVFGGTDHGYTLAGPWNKRLRVAVKNTRLQNVRFDSIRFPRDSMKTGAYSEPMTLVFGCWPRQGNGQLLSYGGSSVTALPLGPAIVIRAGDSIEIGMFEIGHAAVLVKYSASERTIPLGDSISLPVMLFGSGDSLSLIVRAKVQNYTFGSGIISPRRFVKPGASGRGAVSFGFDGQSHGADSRDRAWRTDGRNLSVTTAGQARFTISR